jgi:branched-chain amino acid transport system substrate-binding protein
MVNLNGSLSRNEKRRIGLRIKGIWFILSMVLVAVLLAGAIACAPAATKPAPATPGTPAAPQGPQTIKVALNIGLTNGPWEIDMLHAIQMDVDAVNAAGGMDIGGTKYKVDLIVDDNKTDLAVAKTATQKEVFQDGTKYIMYDLFSDSCYTLTDPNKVIAIGVPAGNAIFDKSLNYTYKGGPGDTNFPGLLAYAANKYPSKKTFMAVLPDRIDGRDFGKSYETVYAPNLGLKVLDIEFYPPSASDLSAVGTKIKQLNPDLLLVTGAGPPGDSLVIKAAYGAGYRGQILGPATIPGAVMVGICGPEPLEGFLSLAWAMEFEPALSDIGKKFKADYTAKFGKWNDPEVVAANEWYMLKGGFQKAGSVDVDKVKAAFDAQLVYPSICGTSKTIPRPDLGISRGIDTVNGDVPVKVIKGGNVQLLEVLSLDQSLKLVSQMYGWK